MSDDVDTRVSELVDHMIPRVKRRVLYAFDRSREDVEFELATLANLLTIKERMEYEKAR